MQSGLINKVAITPANISDDKGLKHVCPNQGAIYTDKAYCSKSAKRITMKKGCHLAAIKKNNMKKKNSDLDRWYSRIRSPYERVFSKQNKRVRYLGIEKNQFAAFNEILSDASFSCAETSPAVVILLDRQGKKQSADGGIVSTLLMIYWS